MIKGHGIDIVDTARIARMLSEHGQRFLDRCFTPAEQRHCAKTEKRHVERLAGRFAVKEAILKVLGTGLRGGIQWTDMEVVPDAFGRPVLTLSGEAANVANQLGITAWHVSISHIESHAVGSAIGEWRAPPSDTSFERDL